MYGILNFFGFKRITLVDIADSCSARGLMLVITGYYLL